jgi:hypothetical protein
MLILLEKDEDQIAYVNENSEKANEIRGVLLYHKGERIIAILYLEVRR